MATKYWLGSTAQVPQVYTITITGTWAAGDYINIYPPSLYHRETGSAIGQGCKITMGSSGLTVANVADKVYRAFGASAHDDNLLDDESRNLGGQEMPELAEFSASYPGTGAVVTVTGPPGVAAYFYMALNTAGDGSLTQATVQSATGKWFWDNGENWSGGVSLPTMTRCISTTAAKPLVCLACPTTPWSLPPSMYRWDLQVGNLACPP